MRVGSGRQLWQQIHKTDPIGTQLHVACWTNVGLWKAGRMPHTTTLSSSGDTPGARRSSTTHLNTTRHHITAHLRALVGHFIKDDDSLPKQVPKIAERRDWVSYLSPPSLDSP
jgi:hypothetical protein